MNKVVSIKKQSMHMLNDFYGKSMTNFNCISDNMNEFLSLINNDTKLKDSFNKIHSLMIETKKTISKVFTQISQTILRKKKRRTLNCLHRQLRLILLKTILLIIQIIIKIKLKFLTRRLMASFRKSRKSQRIYM